MLNCHIKGIRKQRGVAMVEFAIVVPIFILLLMATAEVGRAFYQYNTLTKAVRDGARYLSEHALDAGVLEIDPADETFTRNLVVYGNLLGSGDPLLDDLETDDVYIGGEDEICPDPGLLLHVRVCAEYDYEPIFDFIPSSWFGAANIDTLFTFTATVTMRALT